jgi:predicted aspartyl protease
MRPRAFVSLFVVSALAFVVAQPCAADDLPDAATLQKRIDLALGNPLPNYRETIVGHGPGGDISEVRYHLGDDERTVVGSGPISDESGTWHGEQWERDENGVTIAADELPGEPRTRTVTRGDEPGTLVLSDLSKSGYGTRTIVDAQTARIERVESIHAWGTTSTTYAAYTTIAGRVLPSTWTVTTTQSGTTSTSTYTRRDTVTGDVMPDAVAEPPTPDIVTFPPGATRVDLPTTFDGGQIYVHGNAGGQSALFVLDSGSSDIIISPGLAKRLGLPLFNDVRVTVARQVDIQQTIIPLLKIGPLAMHNVVASVVPVGRYGYKNEDVGLLGFDFFATLAVHIDQLHQHVSVESGWDFHEPADGDAVPLDVNLGNLVPIVSATINGAPSHRLIIDTGGGGTTLLLFDYFSREHPEVFDDPRFSDRFFTGVGGSFTTNAFAFRSLRLGRLNLENFVGYRTTGKNAYPWDIDGIFGAEFLRHFNIDFDYVHGQVVLRQSHDGGLLPAGR